MRKLPSGYVIPVERLETIINSFEKFKTSEELFALVRSLTRDELELMFFGAYQEIEKIKLVSVNHVYQQ